MWEIYWNLASGCTNHQQKHLCAHSVQVVRAAFAPSGPKGCVKFFVASRECSHKGFVLSLIIWALVWSSILEVFTCSDSPWIIWILLLEWWRDPVAKQRQLQSRNVLHLACAGMLQVLKLSQPHRITQQGQLGMCWETGYELRMSRAKRHWLVVWNMNFIFPCIGNSHPNWLSYFSEG